MVAFITHSALIEDQREEAEGNAALIAAAPDMLEALEVAVAALSVHEWLGLAKAAIAKAKS